MLILDVNYWYLQYTQSETYKSFYFVSAPSLLFDIREGITYENNTLPRLMFDNNYDEPDILYTIKKFIITDNVKPLCAKNILLSTPQDWYLYSNNGTGNPFPNSLWIDLLHNFRLGNSITVPTLSDLDYGALGNIDKLIYIYMEAEVNGNFDPFMYKLPLVIGDNNLEYLFSVYICIEIYNLKKDSEVYDVQE